MTVLTTSTSTDKQSKSLSLQQCGWYITHESRYMFNCPFYTYICIATCVSIIFNNLVTPRKETTAVMLLFFKIKLTLVESLVKQLSPQHLAIYFLRNSNKCGC